jgi:hypothetical protein
MGGECSKDASTNKRLLRQVSRTVSGPSDPDYVDMKAEDFKAVCSPNHALLAI